MRRASMTGRGRPPRTIARRRRASPRSDRRTPAVTRQHHGVVATGVGQREGVGDLHRDVVRAGARQVGAGVRRELGKISMDLTARASRRAGGKVAAAGADLEHVVVGLSSSDCRMRPSSFGASMLWPCRAARSCRERELAVGWRVNSSRGTRSMASRTFGSSTSQARTCCSIIWRRAVFTSSMGMVSVLRSAVQSGLREAGS